MERWNKVWKGAKSVLDDPVISIGNLFLIKLAFSQLLSPTMGFI